MFIKWNISRSYGDYKKKTKKKNNFLGLKLFSSANPSVILELLLLLRKGASMTSNPWLKTVI